MILLLGDVFKVTDKNNEYYTVYYRVKSIKENVYTVERLIPSLYQLHVDQYLCDMFKKNEEMLFEVELEWFVQREKWISFLYRDCKCIDNNIYDRLSVENKLRAIKEEIMRSI